MQILGNTKHSLTLSQQYKTQRLSEYLNKTIEDNYGVLFDMAQGQTMEDMINAHIEYQG